MDAVEADLLAAIAADPDAVEPRAIYADWLVAQEHPRGELTIVQLARRDRPDDVELRDRERELTAELSKALIEMTSAEPLPADLIARWYLGCVDALSITPRSSRLLRSTHSDWLARPEFSVVRELEIKGKFARTLRVTTEASLQRTVRRLSFGDSFSTLNQATLASIAKHLPNLTGLHLRCTDVPDLRALAALKLTELSLELHAISDAGVTRICEAQWPLEKFSLRLTMAPDDYLHGPLAQLYNGTFFSGVKHFVVGGSAPIIDIVEWLAVSKRATTVETLTLNLYGTNIDQQRRLERYRDALAKVKFVPLLQTMPYNTDYWDAENCTNLGSFLNYRLERPLDALPCYEQALRIKPDHTTARHNLGIALRKLRRFEESLVAFDTVIAQSRAPTATLFNGRHYTLCELGRRDEARADLERAVQLDANFADAWNNLGVERQYIGDVDGALQAFRRATAINAQHGYSRRNEADLLLEVGLRGSAQQIYRDLLREKPGNGPLMAMLAHAQLEIGDIAGARITLDARLADPTEDNLNRLYVLRGLARQAANDLAGAASDFDTCAARTECPGWFAVSVFARSISDRSLWARVVPDTAITPRQIADALLAHANATRGPRATKFHDATADDQMDCAELAFVAALVDKRRPLAIQRARALASFYTEQGPRFTRKWFQVLTTTVVIGTRALDARTRDLIALVLRAVRGRRRIADVMAIDN